MKWAGWVAVAWLAACGGDETGRDSATTAPVGTSIASADDGDDGDGGGTKLDLGGGADATGNVDPEGGDEGCQKVDVVLSVDNSGSMQEEIAALQGPVFDSFPDALLAVNGGLLDFQLAVIDACNDPPYFHNYGQGGDCNFASGANYMVSTNPAVEAEYACVTQLTQAGYNGQSDGCSGDNDDEQPANTAADAVNDNSGANAGFLRDDAVLLVVAITDEDEKPLPVISAQQVADKIIAAAGGIDNVVFLGIAGGSDCEGPYGSADNAAFVQDVTQIFVDANRGTFWDLCNGNLEAAFQAAVDVVDVACMEFNPVG
jgi:hypothetical protein